MNYVYHQHQRNGTEIVPPLSLERPRFYSHTGVPDLLKECITFYEETVDLENKMEQFQFQNQNLEQKWIVLEQEYLKLEQFVETLKYDLETLKRVKKLIIKPGQLLLKEYEYSMRKIEFEDIPNALNWTNSVRDQSDALQNEIQRHTHISITNLTSNPGNILNTLLDLGSRGIYLFIDPFRLPDDISVFDIKSVKKLYDLFVEMDSACNAALEAPEFSIQRSPHVGMGLRPSSSWLGLIDLETVDGFEAWRLKYYDIPRSYTRHLKSIVQFGTWVNFHLDKIHRDSITIDQKLNQSLNSLSGVIERIDLDIVPEVEMLFYDFFDDLDG